VEKREYTAPRTAAWTASGAVLALFFAVPAIGHPELAEVQGVVDERLAANPDDPALLIHQGRLRAEARDFDGALVSLAHALTHGGDPETVAAGRAQVFLAAGFPHMAKLEYDALLAQHPQAFDVLFERGRAQLALGDVAAADRDFTRAIAHLPAPRPEHIIVHAQAWRQAGKQREALRALDEGMTRVGPLPSLQLTAIDLDVELQRYDRALSLPRRESGSIPSTFMWSALRISYRTNMPIS
jgi:tetratricopeptide (TPR) repeat protein